MASFSKLCSESGRRLRMWLFGDDNISNNLVHLTPTTIIGVLIVFAISYLMMKCLGGQSDCLIHQRNGIKAHSWTCIVMASRTWYCSVCESLLLNGLGVYCDCCGVCADSECVKKANAQFICKSVTNDCDELDHHWIKGNLQLGAICSICNTECNIELGLVDFQCCWCQRTVHQTCLQCESVKCDLGPFRTMIVPPNCVQLVRRKRTLRSVLLKKVQLPKNISNWAPILVVANRKAGNNDGTILLSAFRKYLNPLQVIDLSEQKIQNSLQWCTQLEELKICVRILVAGGDGTIASVLTALHHLDLDPEPQIAIVPLGTGNDLSRALGWGAATTENDLEDIRILLRNLQEAKPSLIDRWKVELSYSRRHLGLKMPNRTLFMYNYLSVGVDAQVALNFHKTRDSAFYVFGSRILNKILYLCFGTHQVVSGDCKNLEQRLDLYLDGVKIDLPELESIVVLNIPFWGGGVNLWNMVVPKSGPQSCHDGILEVVGLYSSFHIAQLQIGLSSPLKLGQARIVEIRLKGSAPIQIDGEPWEQNPCSIKITLTNKNPVLINQNK